MRYQVGYVSTTTPNPGKRQLYNRFLIHHNFHSPMSRERDRNRPNNRNQVLLLLSTARHKKSPRKSKNKK
ncbi:hypothetical protein KQX54_011687 [Cotesia glomerata]|uniref:Uncharacterized protein n=1 Tax=Cotesia glomerata TaxID=32391 RepID=A0AAV7J4W9_COTGL|nr:hypothetical protein KQX54_011687 [Cotesia glomerata]